MKNNPILPSIRTEKMVVNELPNELLIYNLEKNKAFCLNETARLIMDECDGKTSIDEALISLNRKLKTNLSEEMVWMVVEQFKKSDLLQGDYEIPVQTTRVTRRKVLQSAAALGIALPIVTSLVAPTSLHAQSFCIPIEGGQCDLENNNCCTPGVCIDIGDGFTACVGCIPLGTPCNLEGAPCCGQAFCFNTQAGPTGFQCVPFDR